MRVGSIRGNRSRWNEVAPLHVRSPLYRVAEALKGDITLSNLEREILGNTEGLSVVHAMCHIGVDVVSISRTSEVAIGFDYSDLAIGIARDIAVRARVSNAHFLVGDINNVPVQRGAVDVVFLNWGSMVWIQDLDIVFRELRRLLRPGGRVCILDQHPVSLSFRRGNGVGSALVPQEHYFGPRLVSIERLDYADRRAPITNSMVLEARHTMARIVSVAGRVFSRVDFSEHPYLGWPAYPHMRRLEPTIWTLDNCPIPLSFSLQAYT